MRFTVNFRDLLIKFNQPRINSTLFFWRKVQLCLKFLDFSSMLSFLFALNTFIILKLDMLSWKLYVKVLSNRASFISLLALTSS